MDGPSTGDLTAGRDIRTWSIGFLKDATGWSDERCLGWQHAVRGEPARLSGATPEDRPTDLGLADPASRYAVGYRDGLRSLEFEVATIEPLSPAEAARVATLWEACGALHEDSVFPSTEADWAYAADFPIAGLLDLMDGGREDWLAWFRSENAWAAEDGRPGYGDLLTQDVHDPVCVVQHPDGRVDIWDGWHRVAATIVKGASTIKAVVGRRRPEYLPGTPTPSS